VHISLFLVAFLVFIAAIHRWLWARFVRDAALPAPWRRRATWTLVVLAVSIPAAVLLARWLPHPWNTVLGAPGFVWLGVVFYLAVLLVPIETIRLVGRALRRRETFDPSRRDFLARSLAVGGLAVAGGITATAAAETIGRVAVKRVTIPVAGLDPRLAGFRIVQLTDMHVGPMLGGTFVREVVDVANGLDADVVAVTGDLVDGTVDDLREFVAPLATLRARHGVFFVTGNHEYYVGPDPWIAHLETLGIRALRNAHVEVVKDGASFTLAGVEDYAGQAHDNGPDLDRALAGRDASKPVVLLAHQPKMLDDARDAGVAVQLSGHTHGGQMWPFGFLVGLTQPAVSGLHQFGPTALYVSCGTGFWGPPMRVGAPAEVTLVELVPAAG
jgi:predicted MPP superfamily phosphohydrolase